MHNRLRGRLKEASYPVLAIAIIAVVWEMFVKGMEIPAWFLPAPSQVATELFRYRSLLFSHGVVTLLEAVLGFLASNIVGFLTAVIIVWSVPIERALTPLLVLSQTFPKIAVAPLFIIWFGFGLAPKVVISFLIAFFPIVIATTEGLRDVEPEKQDLMVTMGASVLQQFQKVRIPRSLPYFFAGAKVAVALSVIGAVVGEFVGSDRGLGFLIMRANNDMDTVFMFAIFAALAVMGYGLYLVVDRVEGLLLPWHAKIRLRQLEFMS